MLRHLRVTNFAILSDVELELGDGLNVLTGETGAGKSLIVEAVNLLRGGRASADIPRTGTDEATVKAESCRECNAWVKIFYKVKNESLDPVADDVGSLGLDILMGDAGARRGGFNPFLVGY